MKRPKLFEMEENSTQSLVVSKPFGVIEGDDEIFQQPTPAPVELPVGNYSVISLMPIRFESHKLLIKFWGLAAVPTVLTSIISTRWLAFSAVLVLQLISTKKYVVQVACMIAATAKSTTIVVAVISPIHMRKLVAKDRLDS